MREKPVGSGCRTRLKPGLEEFAFDLAALIRFEKIFVQTSAEKFLLPGGERWTNADTGWIGPLPVGGANSAEFFL